MGPLIRFLLSFFKWILWYSGRPVAWDRAGGLKVPSRASRCVPCELKWMPWSISGVSGTWKGIRNVLLSPLNVQRHVWPWFLFAVSMKRFPEFFTSEWVMLDKELVCSQGFPLLHYISDQTAFSEGLYKKAPLKAWHLQIPPISPPLYCTYPYLTLLYIFYIIWFLRNSKLHKPRNFNSILCSWLKEEGLELNECHLLINM